MSELLKRWSVVLTLVLFLGLPAIQAAGAGEIYKITDSTLKQVRETLWYGGVNGLFLQEAVMKIVSNENDDDVGGPSRFYPEELLRALKMDQQGYRTTIRR